MRYLTALALLLVAVPAAAQDGLDAAAAERNGLTTCGGRPCLSAFDGGFTLTPRARIDADAGSFFGQDVPGGFRSGVNLRRGRLTAEGTVLRDFGYRFTWDFGGSNPRDYSFPYEAQVNYSGVDWMTARVGAYTPQHLPEYAGSSFDLLFLERAAITNVAASVASGDSRWGVGVEARGDRWLASFYGTGGTISSDNDDRQRGLVGRAAALVLAEDALQLQLGMNVAYQLQPGPSKVPNAVSYADYPELRVDTRRFLNTRSIPADGGYAWGPEAAGRVGPLYLEGLYQFVGADAEQGGYRRFSGWYVQGAYPLVGSPRRRDRSTGTWARPGAAPDAGPFLGFVRALELAARYSTADLRDRSTRGGRQEIWTVGLNWYPTSALRFAVQYENGTVELDGRDRDFQAVGLRASLNL